MAIFLPGSAPIQTVGKTCSLCDAPAICIALLKIRVFEPNSDKIVVTEIDLAVCEQHSYKMTIQVDKTLKLDKKALFII